MLDSKQLPVERAKLYARIMLGITALFLPIPIIGWENVHSQINFYVAIVHGLLIVGYIFLVKPNNLYPLTLLLHFASSITVAMINHNVGGFVSYHFATICIELVGAGFILARGRWIFAAVAISIFTHLIAISIEMNRTWGFNDADSLLMMSVSDNYKYLAMVSQTILLIGTGVIIAALMHVINQREQALEQSRQAMQQRSDELATLAIRLETSNQQLVSTETTLRQTVDALTVAALPVGDDVVVLPLIGGFDAQRAEAVEASLLSYLHEQRANTLILDLTSVPAASETLLTMLERIIQGARLLGARVILAGLQPEVAPMMVKLKLNRQNVLSAPTLAAALELRST
ncbi:STAS domain-containing protein [Herpetosiphon llansteffanensis]|uniref:STAS domain-containing protein n=1 Tax=Herpetosiphon llansteffanensis TaxID=2094568 RepID=UPI000D7BAFA1|nr:STAS domain-containing protein [Herpetosiphon llansteffanensis]